MIIGKWWMGHDMEIIVWVAVGGLALVEMGMCVWMLMRKNAGR
jgi:hypothetical protein